MVEFSLYLIGQTLPSNLTKHTSRMFKLNISNSILFIRVVFPEQWGPVIAIFIFAPIIKIN